MGGPRGRLTCAHDRKTAIDLINDACSQGARKNKACEILEISVRTLERWQKDETQDKRKGAKRVVANKLTEAEEQLILDVANSPVLCDLPPSKIVPMLADNGIYIASESSFYRLLRKQKLLKHRLLSKRPQHKKPTPCEATGPNQVWSWDITYLPTQVRGMYFYLYIIMDIFSRKIVGWSVHEKQCSKHSSSLIRQACIDEKIIRNQLTLHADNGSPMRGAIMIETLKQLGVTPSFSRPSVSDDNPFSEALFRTIKYHPTYPVPEKFEDIFAARKWVIKFVDWYNNKHMHSALNFITPCQRHAGDDGKILEQRDKVYLKAKSKRPDRWSGNTRNWELPEVVSLNPNKKAREMGCQNKLQC